MERRDDAGPEANGGASKDSDAARGERMRARLRELLASPYSFLPSYAARYETLLHYAQALIPQQAYAMCMLLGRDNASGYPDMPDTASLRFPTVHEVDLSTQVGWYYLNDLCTAEDGTEYGVLCTLFRYALLPPAAAAPFGLTPLEGQVVEVQLALSIADGPFYKADPSLTTGTSGRLAVSAGKLGLSTDDGSFEAIPDGTFLPMRVAARGTDRSGERPVDLEVDLTLVFGRPFLPQGWDGAVPLVAGVGTRYYSVPGLMLYAQGSTLKVDGKAIPLKSGSFWFDHQWGVGLLPQAAPPVEVLRADGALPQPERRHAARPVDGRTRGGQVHGPLRDRVQRLGHDGYRRLAQDAASGEPRQIPEHRDLGAARLALHPARGRPAGQPAGAVLPADLRLGAGAHLCERGALR